eukprot:578587-Alexandrium_andersonii.AAC.1
MSASLVGSEMCIRDSAQVKSLAELGLLRVSRLRPPARTLLASESIPVSYTHLTLPTICSV